MKARTVALFVSLVLLQSFGMSQNKSNDCNETPNSPQKLFVFIGELLDFKCVVARERYNDARFSATYRIIERVCGNYPGDTITFDVIKTEYDSSFTKSKFLLLLLTKDTAENNDYVLWADLYHDLFKMADGQWAGPYMAKDKDGYRYASAKSSLNRRKINFSKKAFYNTRGMTREEIDLAYPEPFYKLKKDKAIPLLGNSITELFQYEKNGFLSAYNIYYRPDIEPDRQDSSILIQDVQLEEIPSYNADSIYLVIKENLLKDPFNEAEIGRLMENCRRQENSDNCSQFFENLIQQYPDSVRAYILKAKFMHGPVSLEDTSRIFVFQQAVKADSNSYEANYYLALSYYELFREDPDSYYARSARRWLMKAADIDTAQLPFLKYPIIQLSKYLNDMDMVNVYNKFTYRVRTNKQGVPEGNTHNWYFPFEVFLNAREKGICERNIDMIRQLRIASNLHQWFSRKLAWFQEPVLSSGYEGDIYRFLWVRSFHDPIVIRIQKNKRNVNLSWKVPRHNEELDVYESVEFKKKVTMKEWKEFQRLLKTIDYWSIIPRDYLSDIADGAIWTLEGSINGRYHITERQGSIYPKYTNCLLYLLSLTDLNLPEDEIY